MLRKLFWCGLVLLGASACSTDFQLEAEPKNIPVVYAFISKQDTAHYIRLEKAFLEPGGNAMTIAKIPDSLYYPNATVQLEKGASSQRFTLARVDGNLEGYLREEGPFATAPNYLYKIKASQLNLRGGEKLRLIINRGSGLPLITAETTVLGDLQLLERPASPIAFVDYNRQISFTWNAPVEAKVFDLRLRLYYRESTAGNNFVSKSLDWILKPDLERGDGDTDTRLTFTITGEQFFRFLANNIEASTSRRRIFDGLDFVVGAAGAEMQEFLRISRANTGITSSQVVPRYSNIPAGLGIFTSRATARRNGLQVNAQTADSLRFGRYTRQLNFQ